MTRPLYEIAREIKRDWLITTAKGNMAAEPYVCAMEWLTNITDNYHADTGKSIVLYFLANAGTWRGETARRIKAELKEMVK